MEEFKILEYIYVELTLGILFITEILRKYLPKPKSAFWKHPKWLTLLVGVGLSAAEYFHRDAVDLSKLVLSLGSSVLFYDYFWKLVKQAFEKLMSKFNVKIEGDNQ